jgi:hypothetical protein
MANKRTFFISSMITEVRLRKFKVGIASHYLMVMRFVHFPILALTIGQIALACQSSGCSW